MQQPFRAHQGCREKIFDFREFSFGEVLPLNFYTFLRFNNSYTFIWGLEYVKPFKYAPEVHRFIWGSLPHITAAYEEIIRIL